MSTIVAEPSHDGEAEAERPTAHLFQWSTFLDIGAGSKGCEHARDGACEDSEHFHCWLCLPNVFQVRDMGEKAKAAKARKRRALLDPTSDANAALDEEIGAWALNDDTYKALIELQAQRNVKRHYGDVMEELKGMERFENRSDDLEEYGRQSKLPEEERDAEEFARLDADITAWSEEFERICLARHEREVIVLTAEKRDTVLDLERRYQIDETCSEVYLHIYYTWAYYICTRVPLETQKFSTERVFKSPEDMKGAAPEVIEALRDNYRLLERRLTGRGDAAGN